MGLLANARRALDARGALAGLRPAGEEWSGTPLVGRLLAPIDTLDVPDPIPAAVLTALGGLTGGAEPLVAALHGWEPGPPGAGHPRGLAYAVRATAGGSHVAAAIALTGEGDGARLTFLAGGAGQVDAADIAMSAGWLVRFAGQAEGTLEFSVGTDGDLQIVSATSGDRLSLAFRRADLGDDGRIGASPGPGIHLGAVTFGADVTVDAGGQLAPSGWAQLEGGSVELAPAALSGLLPALRPIPLDVKVGLDAEHGVTIAGGTSLRVRLPAAAVSAAVRIDAVDIVLDPRITRDTLDIGVGVTSSIRLKLPGVPVELSLDGLGLRVPYSFDDVRIPGFSEVVAALPTGAGVKLDLPVIRGAGRLSHRTTPAPRDDYAGALSVSLPPLAASAYGVLGLAGDGQPFSLLVVLGATFPPPGIQLGFGFAVSGVGGVVAINRRVDRDALLRAVADGTAANLLFPADPVGAGDAVVDALPAIFPPMRGALVAGPMFQLSWGGRLVSASVAVLMEYSDRVRMTILGKIVVAIPDPAAPLILIQATFVGRIDPAVPSVEFVASLTGSHIAFVPLSGDLLLLTRGGDDPTFVLSAGGFHPAFSRPRGVPELRRIGMDLSPVSWLDFRCEAYLAITPNTIQFGARLDLVAEIAGCGLRGHLQLDVLLQRHPHPYFVADIAARIAVEVIGRTLAAVSLQLRLEGPTPWRARGRGSIDLFLFSASLDFDEQWGPQPPLPQAVEDVAGRLREALAKRDAWLVQRPARPPGALRLTPAAETKLGRGELVDPHGSLIVRQRTVPLGVTIQRFNGAPVTEQRWEITAASLGPGRPDARGEQLPEHFALGQFFALSDDEQLSAPAFKRFPAGYGLTATGIVMSKHRDANLSFDTAVVLGEQRGEPYELNGPQRDPRLELVAAADGASHPLWWDAPRRGVTVAAETPVALASSWSLSAIAGTAGSTVTEAQQARGADARTGFAVVETWELGG